MIRRIERVEAWNAAQSIPELWQRFECSLRTLERHSRAGAFDPHKALKLLRNNARDVHRWYMDKGQIVERGVVEYIAHKALNYFNAEIEAGNSWLGRE